MKLKDPVVSMENYLRELLGEYEDKYKEISLSQNVFEAKMKHALESSRLETCSAENLPPNEPWRKLETLKRLRDFLLPLTTDQCLSEEKASQYEQQFLQALDAASYGSS